MFGPRIHIFGSGSPPPVITSVNYSQGDTAGGGDAIIITGSGFTGATPAFGGIDAGSFVVNSDTEIAVALSPASAGSAPISVRGPTGVVSATVPFEYWDPTVDVTTTLLFDSNHTAYNAVSGFWTPRYDWLALPASALRAPGFAGTTNTAVLGGAPLFDGDGANEAGLRSGLGVSWNDFIGAGGTEKAGSIATVFKSSNVQVLSPVSPYSNPTAVGATDSSSGVLGVGFGMDAATGLIPSVAAHTYTTAAAYVPLEVPAAANTFHAVVSRWGTGANTFDLSVDGALSGAGYASTAITSGVDATYTPTPIWAGMNYDATTAANQTFAGQIHAFALLYDKASDTFITKFHNWARQRFGI